MSQNEIFECEEEPKLDTEKKEYEFEGKKYPLKKDCKKELRFIEIDVEEDKKLKRYLIESQNQIDIRLQRNDYDFSNCIFVCVADFSRAQFTEKANFVGAQFTEKANFNGTQFTKRADFPRAQFTKGANFLGAKFTERACFIGAQFTKGANFIGAKFTEEAYFIGAQFTEGACFLEAEFEVSFFDEAQFTKGADFREVQFTEGAGFLGAKFTEKANFLGAKFTEKANFLGAKFTEEAFFARTQFLGPTSFKLAKINSFLIFDEINNKKNELDFSNFKLDLTSTIASNITYSKHNITNVEDRNTWLTLKQAAIKQNDNISALEFHKKEMLQYKEDLKKSPNKNSKVKESSDNQTINNKSNNGQDNNVAKDKKEHFISKTFKFIFAPFCFIYLLFKCFFEGSKDRGVRLILLFEEYASDFGTNAFKSILWIILSTLLFEFLLYLCIYMNIEQSYTDPANFINSYLYSLNPLSHMKDILSPYMISNRPDLISSNIVISIFGIFNFIKNILVGVLIYETIKSFRRFSRKL